MRDQVNESPVVKLTYALMLAAMKKSATQIRIIDKLVEFRIDGELRQEMTPPRDLAAQIIRRLTVMAELPVYGKEESASGQIMLEMNDDRRQLFGVTVRGHGDSLEASVDLLAQ